MSDTAILRHERQLVLQSVTRTKDQFHKPQVTRTAPTTVRGALIPANEFEWEMTEFGQLQEGDQFLFVRRRYAPLPQKAFVIDGGHIVRGQLRGGTVYQVQGEMDVSQLGPGWGEHVMYLIRKSPEGLKTNG